MPIDGGALHLRDDCCCPTATFEFIKPAVHANSVTNRVNYVLGQWRPVKFDGLSLSLFVRPFLPSF
jgi:hypothetical protein